MTNAPKEPLDAPSAQQIAAQSTPENGTLVSSEADECADLFSLHPPTGEPLPVVANLPHSGLKLPASLAAQFTAEQRRSLPNSDWHLQPLYSFLPSLGVTVMEAHYSRYVVDLNRALRPPFLGSFWSAVVPEYTAFKQPIYRQTPTPAEVRSRIERFWSPYHRQLSALLQEKIAQFGRVYLFDLHSFMGLLEEDVCLGNANGATCGSALLEATYQSFAQQGYRTVKNKVFTGGYITRHYGQQPEIEALQIEIRYPVYLSAEQLTGGGIPAWGGDQFSQAQGRLQAIFQDLLCSAIR